MTNISFLDILDRTKSGPLSSLKDWDIKKISKTTNDILINFNLQGTFDRSNPINTDDGLADEFFKAGYELALRTGFFCTNTERIINIDESELNYMLKETPEQISLGEPNSQDEVSIRHRKPEDSHLVANWFGPAGNQFDEDIHIQAIMCHAQYKVVDILTGGLSTTLYGREIRAKEPIDYFLGLEMATRKREAARRVGRPGMPCTSIGPAGTEYGLFGAELETRSFDSVAIPAISELKLDYSILFRIASRIHMNVIGFSFLNPIIGGYAGGPEGAAIMRIAACLLMVPVYQAPVTGGEITDFRFNCNCSREAVWAASISTQALARNVNHVIYGNIDPPSGPCTKTILYESCINAMNETTSGASMLFGVVSGGGRWKNHSTGLESKFSGEITRALCRKSFKRTDANEIAKKIIPKYENNLDNPRKGKSILECYDIKNLKPTSEWMDIYTEVKKELTDMGLPLE